MLCRPGEIILFQTHGPAFLVQLPDVLELDITIGFILQGTFHIQIDALDNGNGIGQVGKGILDIDDFPVAVEFVLVVAQEGNQLVIAGGGQG
ncbi:hypothetical protein D3C75_1070010 [compost metagenome]